MLTFWWSFYLKFYTTLEEEYVLLHIGTVMLSPLNYRYFKKPRVSELAKTIILKLSIPCTF